MYLLLSRQYKKNKKNRLVLRMPSCETSSSELNITLHIQHVGIYWRLYEPKLHLAFWSLDLLWVSAHMVAPC